MILAGCLELLVLTMVDVKPDFSAYVAHFTSERKPTPQETGGATELSAEQKRAIARGLASILTTRSIWRTKMPWYGARCAAFTERTWTSLFAHAEHYSAYGIGFSKWFLHDAGGGPAIYLRPDAYDAQRQQHGGPFPFAEAVRDFLTPFSMKPFILADGTPYPSAIDFTHEREWRVPGGLSFGYDDVRFVIVEDADNLATCLSLPSRQSVRSGSSR
jgi:hypothetical protein